MTPEMTADTTDTKDRSDETLIPLPVFVQKYSLRYDTCLNGIYRGRLAAKRIGARWWVYDVPNPEDES